jgi:RNA polymerase sigma-70 factor (ECF subfamily)
VGGTVERPEVLTGDSDAGLVAALRAGDEAAFMALVEALGAAMVRVARSYVPSDAVAQEVVQETWLAVLEGLDRFEGRSTLQTWIFRILVNRARTRGARERRSMPFSSYSQSDEAEPSVAPDRFQGEGDPYPGHWSSPPTPWDELPESRLESKETLERIRSAIDVLPPNYREVITLRDIEGWSSPEVCNALELSETNQRVLLHRARSRVRRALERYLDDEDR